MIITRFIDKITSKYTERSLESSIAAFQNAVNLFFLLKMDKAMSIGIDNLNIHAAETAFCLSKSEYVHECLRIYQDYRLSSAELFF